MAASVQLRIEPREKSLGEFTVRRVLPAVARRMLGPFVFFDHMGPADFPPGKGIQVRPHPHIGLATITYLFEGEIIHRDDLGVVQAIQTGAVNLMTAGRGIVHSERAGDDLNELSHLHGIQSWIALPVEDEEAEPSFLHYPASDLPEIDVNGVRVRVIMGTAFGHTSRVKTYSETLYLECRLPAGTEIEIPAVTGDLGAYSVEGEVQIEDGSFPGGVLAVAKDGESLRIQAKVDSRVMIIGGDNLGERHLWWNFVSSSRERLEQAKDDWKEGRFGKVPGDDEFIPLPER